jgi:hypothetical protein
MITSRFRARGTSGVVYEVVCRQPEIDTSTLQGRDSLPGMPEYRLEDGWPLRVIDVDTFEIVESGQRLTRIK